MTPSDLTIFSNETLGTALLILLGVGVNANTTLKTSPAKGAGWVLIAFGWGLGVFVGASLAAESGAHLNPAVTLALALDGTTAWSAVPVYIASQLLGAFIGAVAAWAVFKLQFDRHDDNASTGSLFFTQPNIPNPVWNVVSEVLGTFVLVIWVLSPAADNSTLGYAGVMFVVVAVGASLGGPTGYAINPARDLGPRLAYAVLPIPGKGTAQWGYSWVPILGPALGALLAFVVSLGL